MRSQHFSASRWLIFVPVALFAIYAKPVKADVLGDWEYSQSAACGGSVEVVDNTITLHGPDQNGCSGAAHWVKIETTIPADVDTIDFSWSYQTNDGWVYDPPQYGINGVYTLITQQNNASGTKTVPVTEGDIFTFRQYSIDTCCAPGHLSISSLSLWEFTTTSTSSTTTSTTTVPMETVPVTDPVGTTLPVTTTSSAPTTSLPQSEPTMPEPSSTTTTTTTSLVPETTTTTEPVSPPPAQPPATVEQPPTTEPAPPDTEPSPLETQPVEETIPLEPPDTEPEASDTTDLPPDTAPPVEDTAPPVPDTEPAPPDTEPAPPETLPDAPEAPLSDEQVDSLVEEATTTEALVEALSELSDEQVEQVLEAILAEEPTQEQATALASSPEVLAIVSTEQATEIFEALDVTELDNTQLEALAEAVTDAPTEIKEAFEESVDIFSNGLGTYVPVDSKIPVSERRTLIAIAAGATLTAASTRMKR